MAGFETIPVKEYTADHAGELTGWVNVTENEETELVIASMAYARVSPEGATYSYYFSDGEELHSKASVRGFEYSTELTVAGRDESVLDTTPSKAPGLKRGYTSPREIETGFANTFYPSSGNPLHSEGVWVDGRDEDLFAVLQAQLGEYDAEWMYPTFYYYLAQMTVPDLILADTAMAPITEQKEMVSVREYAAHLATVKSEDERMLETLTAFSDIPADQIPDTFKASRRKVAAHERQAQAAKNKTVTGSWLRNIADVLTWPYMNPLTEDEHAAFGMELQDLEARNVNRARHALERELPSLDKRLETASIVSGKLSMLHSLEIG